MARKLPRKDEVKTDVNWQAVKEEMDGQAWEEDSDNRDMEVRRIFLGTVFALCPSGKYYTPFANSNVNPCPACHGTCEIIPRGIRFRTLKKWRKARDRCWKLMEKRGFKGDVRKLYTQSAYRYYRYAMQRMANFPCELCEGLGSYEAKLDEIYYEKLEAEAGEHGYAIENGEGDPCDVFISEYRDKPETEEVEEEDAQEA